MGGREGGKERVRRQEQPEERQKYDRTRTTRTQTPPPPTYHHFSHKVNHDRQVRTTLDPTSTAQLGVQMINHQRKLRRPCEFTDKGQGAVDQNGIEQGVPNHVPLKVEGRKHRTVTAFKDPRHGQDSLVFLVVAQRDFFRAMKLPQ